jgi:hypothetical protein
MSSAPEYIQTLGESYARLWEEFSEFPTREEVSARIRIFKPKSLANLDCQGRGPAGRRLIAGRVCYHRDQVITWFASLSGPPKSKQQVFASCAAERK